MRGRLCWGQLDWTRKSTKKAEVEDEDIKIVIHDRRQWSKVIHHAATSCEAPYPDPGTHDEEMIKSVLH